MDGAALYERDFYAWANEQAALLRAGRLSEADAGNIAEEIESIARGEKRELVRRLTALLTHLLTWQACPNRRDQGWRLTVKAKRIKLAKHLADSPSLKGVLPDALADAYRLALLGAQERTGLDEDAFPAVSPWDAETVMADWFLLE